MLKKNNISQILYLLAGITAYCICIKFSKDWIHYLWWYGLLESQTWPEIWQGISPAREPLYNLPVKFLSVHIGYSKVILIATVVLTWVKFRFLSKIVSNEYIGMFFYICLYWLLLEGTQLRVAYATTFIIMGFFYLQNQRYWLSLLMVLVASQIHFTAILFGIIFFLYFVKSARILTLGLFLLSPLLIVFDVSIYAMLERVITMINPRYLLYGSEKVHGQNSTGLYVYFIAFFWVTLVLIEWQLKCIQKNKFKLTLQRTAMTGVILMCAFHDHVALGARLGELLLIPMVMLLSWLYIQYTQVHNSLALNLLTITSIAYFIARFIYLFPSVKYLLQV